MNILNLGSTENFDVLCVCEFCKYILYSLIDIDKESYNLGLG